DLDLVGIETHLPEDLPRGVGGDDLEAVAAVVAFQHDAAAVDLVVAVAARGGRGSGEVVALAAAVVDDGHVGAALALRYADRHERVGRRAAPGALLGDGLLVTLFNVAFAAGQNEDR